MTERMFEVRAQDGGDDLGSEKTLALAVERASAVVIYVWGHPDRANGADPAVAEVRLGDVVLATVCSAPVSLPEFLRADAMPLVSAAGRYTPALVADVRYTSAGLDELRRALGGHETGRCIACGSTDIHHTAWIDAAGVVMSAPGEGPLESAYCNGCNMHSNEPGGGVEWFHPDDEIPPFVKPEVT